MTSVDKSNLGKSKYPKPIVSGSIKRCDKHSSKSQRNFMCRPVAIKIHDFYAVPVMRNKAVASDYAHGNLTMDINIPRG